jgi:hypothetical protein
VLATPMAMASLTIAKSPQSTARDSDDAREPSKPIADPPLGLARATNSRRAATPRALRSTANARHHTKAIKDSAFGDSPKTPLHSGQFVRRAKRP